MKRLLNLLAVVLVSAMSTFAFASEISTSGVQVAEKENVPYIINKMATNHGVKFTWLGNVGGVLSYLAESKDGKLQAFHVTPDGKHIIAGLMFDSKQKNITIKQIAKITQQVKEPVLPKIEKPEFSEVAPELKKVISQYLPDKDAFKRFVEEAENIAWFELGQKSAPVIYKISDPQCPYCHKAWADIIPFVQSGQVRLRVIMVGYLPGSEEISRAILSKDDPGKAWLRGEGSRRNIVVADIPKEGSERYLSGDRYLKINNDFAHKYNIAGTPFLAYMVDGIPYYSAGRPLDMASFLNALL